jgi:hypothetical protein
MVFSLEPAANPFGITQKKIITAHNFPLCLVSFQHKIKKLKFCTELLKIREDGVFTAEADIKILFFQARKRPENPFKIKPKGLVPLRSEKSESVPPSGKFVPDFNITPDSPEDFHMRKERRNLHLRSSIETILPESRIDEKGI